MDYLSNYLSNLYLFKYLFIVETIRHWKVTDRLSHLSRISSTLSLWTYQLEQIPPPLASVPSLVKWESEQMIPKFNSCQKKPIIWKDRQLLFVSKFGMSDSEKALWNTALISGDTKQSKTNPGSGNDCATHLFMCLSTYLSRCPICPGDQPSIFPGAHPPMYSGLWPLRYPPLSCFLHWF